MRSENNNEQDKSKLKLCPECYIDFYDEMDGRTRDMSGWLKFATKLIIKLGFLEVIKLSYMNSDSCELCSDSDTSNVNRKLVCK